MSLIPLDEAVAYVMDRCQTLPVVTVDLSDALGAIAASACVSNEAIPAFDNTSMDGYAVRAVDTVGASETTPVTLDVVGTLAAGTAPEIKVGPGQAVRIMTGAPVPDGCDAIVKVEDTRRREEGASEVEVLAMVEPGLHIRRVGEDIRPGDVVFGAGIVVHAGHVGLLARVGSTGVDVVRPPRVAVFSTGDELVDGSGDLKPGQIRDSNRPTLVALVAEAGFEAVDFGLIGDDADAIADAMRRAVSTCDAVVTSGGVSMGDFDLVKVVLADMGDMRWMQIAIKPAKPLAFGLIAADSGARRVPVFGLPGNPVSAMVSFELFVRPALRKMAGHSPDTCIRERVRAVVDEPLGRLPHGKTVFERVVCTYGSDGLYHVRSAGPQGSHQLSVMADANALAVLDDETDVIVGSVVDVMLLR